MTKEQNITNNIQAPNTDLDRLKQNFPNCFDKNGDFDFEKFKNQLSKNDINFSKESYGMDWLGKSYARLLATDEATTLLKEDEAHNKKYENTNSQNLLIKGDNLEVLKHLSHAYYEKIKMIYIDPPYNTGSDGFVYADDRKFDVPTLMELAGISEERAKRILEFTQSKSNSHSAWLTFMYPRLYIAKQLLKEDGVIFVSIDDNEVAQLRLLMDEVFGEENFVGEIVIKSNPSGRDYGGISLQHDYVLVYSKNSLSELNMVEDKNKIFKYKDDISEFDDRELRNRNIKFNDKNRPNLYYPFYVNSQSIDSNGFYEISLESKENWEEVYPLVSQGIQTVWRWGKKKALENLNINIKGKIKKDGTFQIIEKYRSSLIRERSIFDEKNIRNEYGTLSIKGLFGKDKPFEYPKSPALIKKLLNLAVIKDDITLDFFAGSGTTGDAVMQLNAEDGGSRKFILVQLPEPIDSKKNKTAYDFVQELNTKNSKLKTPPPPTIFDITKERLMRAAKKINAELDEKTKTLELDIKSLKEKLPTEETQQEIKNLQEQITKNSTLKTQNYFRVFETMPIWEEYHFEADELDEQNTFFNESKLTKEDIKALLLTWKTYDGALLVDSFECIVLSGKNSETQNYPSYYGNGKLYLMDKGFKTEHLKALLEKIDSDTNFNPTTIIAFGYHFESKSLREISENIKSYANKKHIDIDFITRY